MNAIEIKKAYMNYTKKSVLPSEYQRVEYIESSGTQVIDTQWYPSGTSKVEADVMFIKNTSSEYELNGARGSSSNGNYYVGAVSNTTPPRAMFGYGTGTLKDKNTSTSISYNTRYKETLDGENGIFYLNGVSIYTFTTETSFVCDATYKIGGRSLSERVTAFVGRIYNIKLYDNSVLVRDYIPCYRKSDNEIGLYDLVSKQFFTNSGSGTFAMGRPLVYDTIDGYQQVDYIQSSGTQYIDTQIKPNGSTEFDIDFITNNVVSNSGDFGVVFGVSSGNTDRQYKIETWASAYWGIPNGYFGYGTGEGSGEEPARQTKTNAYLTQGERTNIAFKNGDYIVNGETKYSIELKTFDCQFNLYLFGENNGSSFNSGKVLIYSFKLLKDNSLVRNFIPMRRTSDNELGLYDLVNNVFYTNSGSGSFSSGVDIVNIDGYQQLEYISGNGAYIEFPYETNGSTIGFDISFYTPSLSLSGDTPLIQNDAWNNWVPIGLSLTDKNKSYFGSYSINSPIYWTNDTYTYNEDRYQINYLNSNSINSIGKSNWTHSITKDLSGVSITKWTIMSANVPSTYHLNFLIMTDGTSVIARFIPMQRLSDNEIGLYDTISKTFFTNQGSSEFLKGGNK